MKKLFILNIFTISTMLLFTLCGRDTGTNSTTDSDTTSIPIPLPIPNTTKYFLNYKGSVADSGSILKMTYLDTVACSTSTKITNLKYSLKDSVLSLIDTTVTDSIQQFRKVSKDSGLQGIYVLIDTSNAFKRGKVLSLKDSTFEVWRTKESFMKELTTQIKADSLQFRNIPTDPNVLHYDAINFDKEVFISISSQSELIWKSSVLSHQTKVISLQPGTCFKNLQPTWLQDFFKVPVPVQTTLN